LLPILVLMLPVFVHAQTIDALLGKVKSWMTLLLPIMVGVALIVFIWGLITFIAKAGDETARTEGKQRMVWGIIAMFVIVSIWGLVTFIRIATGVNTSTTIVGPKIPN